MKSLAWSLANHDPFAVTPFDVVKTRLQTQMPRKQTTANVQTCLHAPHLPCARSMSSLAPSLASSTSSAVPNALSRVASHQLASSSFLRSGSAQLPNELCVCFYEGGAVRAHRVTGFWDALIQVARFEGIRGLWKGVGTTL
jgi:solute carrier family 25 protein 39/40